MLLKLLPREQVSRLVFICRATVISPILTKDDTRMLSPLTVGDAMRLHWIPAPGLAEGAHPPSTASSPGGLGAEWTQPSHFLPRANPDTGRPVAVVQVPEEGGLNQGSTCGDGEGWVDSKTRK